MTNPNTPGGGPSAALPVPRRGRFPRPRRGRLARRAAAVASVLTAAGVLAAPALVPSASSAGDLAFPYTNAFDTAAGGTLDGDAVVRDGRLRLTDAVRSQAGAWSTNDTFPSDLGLEIEFEYSMYNDLGEVGADGLLLFLADGAAPQGVGAYGAALGYACRSSITEGGSLPCDLPGVPGGFAAVALDRYGNFSQTINASGPGRTPDTVVVRGSGNDVTGYRYVDGVRAPGGVETDSGQTRRVRVTLLPDSDGQLSLTVRLEQTGTMRTVLDRVPLQGDGQTPLPSTLRLGFTAATGQHVDVHEVDSLTVSVPTDLAVEHDMPPTVQPGRAVEYSVTARNVGPNPSDPSRLEVDVPDAVEDVTWTCSAHAGSACGTGSGTGDVAAELDLPRDGRATVTISGRVPAEATGTLESVARITPAPSLADTDEDDNVSRAAATVEPGAGPEAHVETDKSVSPSTGVAPGDEVEYLVTARNRGPGTAAEVGAVDELPRAMRFVGSPDGCTAAGRVVTCSSGRSLEPGASVAFRIRAQLDPGYGGDGSDVVNVATATSPTDPDGGDPSPEVPIGVVPPGDDGPGDDGSGDDGPGDDGPGDGGPGDAAGVDDRSGPERTGEGRGGDRTRALAYTGAEDLGLLAAVAGVALGAGAACWWLARRRARRTTPAADDTVS
ncbi:lectin-like domain-containing protein [Curtobacterium sp. SP.BCo]|uniref:hypothetical protein n=1 Tax=Curtobacterium sp. SP.BCo TaxID=3435229 RepID=UPI003F739143